MGQCGCGDFQPDFKFKGPDGITYVVQMYPSCDYCDNTAGVIIYAFTPKESEMWGLEHVPVKEINSDGTFISVIHPKHIMGSVMDGIQAYIEDGFENEFRNAVFKTQNEESKWLSQLHQRGDGGIGRIIKWKWQSKNHSGLA